MNTRRYLLAIVFILSSYTLFAQTDTLEFLPVVEVKAINKLDAQSPFSYSSLSDSSLRAVNTGQETSVIIQSMPAATKDTVILGSAV